METQFKLGPLQEKWLKELEDHPERQHKGSLGIKTETGELKMCCLGQAGIMLGAIVEEGGELSCQKSTQMLPVFKLIGLISDNGALDRGIEVKGVYHITLAGMNDNGMTWPEIAAEIRKDPTNFFTESK